MTYTLPDTTDTTDTTAPAASPPPRENLRALLILVLLLAALFVAALCSTAFGVREVGTADVWAALQGKTDTASQAAAHLRIPRTLLAIAVGASLAVAGTTLQAITRNPLADPGIFGVLSGAALAVVIGLTFFQLSGQVPTFMAAVVGAAATSAFVYFVGSLGPGGATPLSLALAGAATAAAVGSTISAILLPRAQAMDAFRHWQIGSVGGADFGQLGSALPFLLTGFLLCWVSATGLNALALGDDLATGLGASVSATRLLSYVGAVILCGVATALAGPIGFIGLIVPHLCRLLVGTDHRWLLPVTAVTGAVLLVAADTVGRVVARPSEIAVAILTPVIGVPVFIWIVRRQKVREL